MTRTWYTRDGKHRDRWRNEAAVEILRLAQLPAGWHQIGPAEAEEIVRQIVKARRAQTPGLSDTLAEDGKGLPPFEQHMADTWRNERWNRKKRPPAPKWRERAGRRSSKNARRHQPVTAADEACTPVPPPCLRWALGCLTIPFHRDGRPSINPAARTAEGMQ